MLELTPLEQEYIKACLNGNMDKVNYLIKSEVKRYKNNNLLTEYLLNACEGGHNDVFVALLTYKNTLFSSVLKHHHQFDEIVISSCKGGNVDIINHVCRSYMKKYSNFKLNMFYNCLRGACEGDNVTLFKKYAKKINTLTNRNANHVVDGLPKNDYEYEQLEECLHSACEAGSVVLVNMVLDMAKKFKNFASDRYIFNHCLYRSCLSENIELVKMFIKYGADHWERPLCAALKKGNTQIVEFFIDLTLRNLDFGEPLNYNNCMWEACYGGSMTNIELLINNGCTDWNAGLEGACSFGNIEIAKFMITKGATNWNRALAEACRRGYILHMDIVKLMIYHGATNYNEIFKYACSCGDLELVKLSILLRNNRVRGGEDGEDGMGGGDEDNEDGEDEDIHFNRGLESACSYNHTNVVELILSYDSVDTNCLNRCLGDAVYFENIDIQNMLINKGANMIEYLRDTEDYKLFGLYCKNKAVNGVINKSNIVRRNKLLHQYPGFVLLVGSRVKDKNNNCSAKRLPKELFRMLFECL